jgi:CrcB protein
MFKTILYIGIGSFSGGIARFLISKYVQDKVMLSFPFGTFIVNVLGCFIIGMLYGLFDAGHLMNNNLRLFLTVGFCGGFTTFSTFMNENYQLLKDENYFYFVLYATLSFFVGLVMLYFGNLITKQL